MESIGADYSVLFYLWLYLPPRSLNIIQFIYITYMASHFKGVESVFWFYAVDLAFLLNRPLWSLKIGYKNHNIVFFCCNFCNFVIWLIITNIWGCWTLKNAFCNRCNFCNLKNRKSARGNLLTSGLPNWQTLTGVKPLPQLTFIVRKMNVASLMQNYTYALKAYVSVVWQWVLSYLKYNIF